MNNQEQRVTRFIGIGMMRARIRVRDGMQRVTRFTKTDMKRSMKRVKRVERVEKGQTFLGEIRGEL